MALPLQMDLHIWLLCQSSSSTKMMMRIITLGKHSDEYFSVSRNVISVYRSVSAPRDVVWEDVYLCFGLCIFTFLNWSAAHWVAHLLGTPTQSNTVQYNSPAIDRMFVRHVMVSLMLCQSGVDSLYCYFSTYSSGVALGMAMLATGMAVDSLEICIVVLDCIVLWQVFFWNILALVYLSGKKFELETH